MTLALTTSSAADTQSVAATLAELAVAGDVFLLTGEMGAGKTAFVQGFGRALGVQERITSPTFTLANQYMGRLEVNHLDVYRLEQIDEVTELGLHELVDGPGVTLIEWGEVVAPMLATDYLVISLSFGAGDDDRLVEIRCIGEGWAARADRLQQMLGAEIRSC